jgi:hypothetical protein
MDYIVYVARKDGSQRVYRVYGQPKPRPGDEIALPSDEKFIRAKVDIPNPPDAAEAVAREILIVVPGRRYCEMTACRLPQRPFLARLAAPAGAGRGGRCKGGPPLLSSVQSVDYRYPRCRRGWRR